MLNLWEVMTTTTTSTTPVPTTTTEDPGFLDAMGFEVAVLDGESGLG